MPPQRVKGIVVFSIVWVVLLCTSIAAAHERQAPAPESQADRELEAALRTAGFTGRIEATLERRIGRRIDHQLADVGRLLWFDTIIGLNNDNTCAGCHSPTNGFGDTQSIAIGIENNGVVGPHWPAQYAAYSYSHQHGLLSQAHVELALCCAIWRPLR